MAETPTHELVLRVPLDLRGQPESERTQRTLRATLTTVLSLVALAFEDRFTADPDVEMVELASQDTREGAEQ
jgi:hypothetical protein